MTDACDPESGLACDECVNNSENRCWGVCGVPDKTSFALPDDLQIATWLCRLNSINDDIRCKRRPRPTREALCGTHAQIFVPSLISRWLEMQYIVDDLSRMSETERVNLFMTEAAIVLLDVVHWQQFLAMLEPGREALLQALVQHPILENASPGLWLRLTQQLCFAVVNLNPPGKLPIRLPLMDATTVERWISVAQNQPFNTRFVMDALLRLNAQNMKDGEEISDQLRRGAITYVDALPEDMLEFVESGGRQGFLQ